MLDDNEKSEPKGMIPFCSTHYRMLMGILTLLLVAVSFYKAFPILLNPVIEKGTVEDYNIKSSIRSRYGGGSALDVVPIIQFQYKNKTYKIAGGSANRLFTNGEKTEVIFNKSSPNKACEYSFMGLIDFPIAYIALAVWFILSALLLGANAYTTDDE